MSSVHSNMQPHENPSLISGKYIPLEWGTDDPPALEFFIDPLAPTGAVTIINAHGGTGKSLLALKMLIHAALEKDILDATTSGDKVAYMSLEDPELVFRQRFYKITQSMPDDVLPRLEELSKKLMFINRYGLQTPMANFEPGRVVETEIADALVNLLQAHTIKGLVVDTFVRTHSLNENDNAQMGALLVIFEKIAVEAQCAVILIHHQPKDNSNRPYASRGASAITDNARSVISLETVSKNDADKFADEDIRIAVREGRLVRATHTKHNYSAEHPEQYFEITENGVPVERTLAMSDISSLEQRYLELYAWWQKVWESKPITKTNIDEHYTEMRPQGTSHGKESYKKALQAAIEDGYAEKTSPPEGASKNPKAKYYILHSLDEDDADNDSRESPQPEVELIES